MKPLYITLYITAVLLLLIVLLGGSITKPIFDNFSSRTLNTAGVKKEAVDSLDNRIDEAFHQIKLVEYQIEKFRNLFSDKKVDENKYKKESNAIFARNIYNPLVGTLNYVYRFALFLIALILLLSGAITHIVYRNMSLRRRVSDLEKAVYKI